MAGGVAKVGMVDFQQLIEGVYRELSAETERGKVADYIPGLAGIDPGNPASRSRSSTGRDSVPAKRTSRFRSRASLRCSRSHWRTARWAARYGTASAEPLGTAFYDREDTLDEDHLKKKVATTMSP